MRGVGRAGAAGERTDDEHYVSGRVGGPRYGASAEREPYDEACHDISRAIDTGLALNRECVYEQHQ